MSATKTPSQGLKLEPHQVILRPLVTEKGVHRAPVVVVAPPVIAPVRPRAVVPCAPPAPVVEAPSDGDGYLVLASTPLVVGQLVRSYWGSSYYPAQVTSVNADGTVGVHYVGWADMWDERAPRTHLRIAR